MPQGTNRNVQALKEVASALINKSVEASCMIRRRIALKSIVRLAQTLQELIKIGGVHLGKLYDHG